MRSLAEITNKIRNKVRKEKDLLLSRSIDTLNIKSVCMILGPYRNLTTLTGSILFLHPHCQVLNHAGNRIFNDPRVDFLRYYSDKVFENYLQYSIYISQHGQRGGDGGSILHSHAFDEQHQLRSLFQESGNSPVKQNISSLFWKESLKITNHIRNHNIDLSEIFRQNQKLRFLIPVRNPLDCAMSNLNTGLVHIFNGNTESLTKEQVLEKIIDEYQWMQKLAQNNPDRFLFYFENNFTHSVLENIADFLCLEKDNKWLDNALLAFNVKSRYTHDEQFKQHYTEYVKERLKDYPDFQLELLKFV